MNYLQFSYIFLVYIQYTYLEIFSMIVEAESIISFFSSPSSISSIECLFLALGVAPNEITYMKVKFWELLPLAKMVLTVILLLILYKLKKIKKFKSSLLTTIFTLILFEQPGLLLNLIRFCSCFLREANHSGYVQIDPAIECSDPRYLDFVKSYVFPGIVLWGAFVPLGILVVLFIKRRSLDDMRVRENYGDIINSYKPTVFYWGLVTMLFKLVILLPLSLINDTTGAFLSCLVIVFVYFHIFSLTEPYSNEELLNIEKYSIMTYLMTLFLLTLASTKFYSSMGFGILISVLLINAGMLIYIIRQIVIKYKQSKRLGRFTFSKEIPERERKPSFNLVMLSEKNTSLSTSLL